jgi:chromate reductase, NAD(P)H dehydrogenase (quinone)
MCVVSQNPSHLELRLMTQLRLLGLSGSLRRASISTAVLRGLQDALAPKALASTRRNRCAPCVRPSRQRMAWSWSRPSTVLKNSLDWASRPYGCSVLRGKPVLTITASPAFTGGVRAQQQMNETLASIPARPVLRPQIVIGGVHEKVSDGRLVDEATLRFALAGVDDLLDEIRAARFVRAAA